MSGISTVPSENKVGAMFMFLPVFVLKGVPRSGRTNCHFGHAYAARSVDQPFMILTRMCLRSEADVDGLRRAERDFLQPEMLQ